MAQSLSYILLHITFSTKYRYKTIPTERLDALHAFIAKVCANSNTLTYKVGGIEDHIHMACILPRTITVADLLRDVKRASSKWLKQYNPDFKWQDGYGVFSISRTHKESLMYYIENQRKHHEKENYHEEIRRLCKKYEISFNDEFWG